MAPPPDRNLGQTNLIRRALTQVPAARVRPAALAFAEDAAAVNLIFIRRSGPGVHQDPANAPARAQSGTVIFMPVPLAAERVMEIQRIAQVLPVHPIRAGPLGAHPAAETPRVA